MRAECPGPFNRLKPPSTIALMACSTRWDRQGRADSVGLNSVLSSSGVGLLLAALGDQGVELLEQGRAAGSEVALDPPVLDGLK